MVSLLFHLGEQGFVLPAADVEAVLPLAELRPIRPAAPALAGVLHYQGRWLPVLDLRMLIVGERCRTHYSSRILLMRGEPEGGVGLCAEQVVDMVDLPLEAALNTPPVQGQPPWLDPRLFEVGGRLVRWLKWQSLVAAELPGVAGE